VKAGLREGRQPEPAPVPPRGDRGPSPSMGATSSAIDRSSLVSVDGVTSDTCGGPSGVTRLMTSATAWRARSSTSSAVVVGFGLHMIRGGRSNGGDGQRCGRQHTWHPPPKKKTAALTGDHAQLILESPDVPPQSTWVGRCEGGAG